MTWDNSEDEAHWLAKKFERILYDLKDGLPKELE